MAQADNGTMTKTSADSVRQRAKKIPVTSLRSNSYDVVEFYKNHEKIQQSLPIDLSKTIELARSLPLGLRGDVHRSKRLAMAQVLKDGRVRLLRRLPGLIEKHFQILKSPGQHDLLNGSCIPFVDDCMCVLSGLEMAPQKLGQFSDIFDPGISLQKRKALERAIATVLEDSLAREVDETHCDGTIALAVAVMGRDALLGSLVFSLNNHFAQLINQPIASSRFPTVPLETGVPYVWRESVEPGSFGELFECRLDEPDDDSDKHRMTFFGLGRHTCLGKQHSLTVFEELSNYLSSIKRTIASVSVSEIDYHVLRIPERFEVTLV